MNMSDKKKTGAWFVPVFMNMSELIIQPACRCDEVRVHRGFHHDALHDHLCHHAHRALYEDVHRPVH